MVYGRMKRKLPGGTQTAGIGIIRSAAGNRQHAGAGSDELVLGRGGGGLRGGSYTGEDEDDNDGADDVFHNGIPLKLYLLKKISLDNQMR
jgi:hypothetical protein